MNNFLLNVLGVLCVWLIPWKVACIPLEAALPSESPELNKSSSSDMRLFSCCENWFGSFFIVLFENLKIKKNWNRSFFFNLLALFALLHGLGCNCSARRSVQETRDSKLVFLSYEITIHLHASRWLDVCKGMRTFLLVQIPNRHSVTKNCK